MRTIKYKNHLNESELKAMIENIQNTTNFKAHKQ